MAIQTVKTGGAVNDGTGDDARTAFTKINQNFTDSANAASRKVGIEVGNLIPVGSYGIGSWQNLSSLGSITPDMMAGVGLQAGFFAGTQLGLPVNSGGFLSLGQGPKGTSGYTAVTGIATSEGRMWLLCMSADGTKWNTSEFKTTNNTSIDANGFIKAASPIVKLFSDSIELNDEAKLQPITLEKLSVGDYLIKGSLGFAQEGWYIEMPKDANGNVLVVVVYEQLDNNDISVKTYDYMLNKKGRIVPDLETPLDIPATRWIDLRLQALPQDDTQPFNTDETVATDAE